MVVLREHTHLDGRFRRVETENFFEHQSVRDAVSDVVERAEFVSHGVADSEERVCERHTCHCCGVSHFFTGFNVYLTVIVSAGEIFEYRLQRLFRKTVGIIGSHNRSVCFQRVGNGVDTGSGGKSSRRAHMEIGVDYSHIGQQLIVCERIFDSAVLIGDDGDRSNFRTRAGGSRDSDEVRFFSHLREGVNSLTDIDESHRHIHEVCFGVFVKNPHYFARVHCRAAAESDDRIGFERTHEFRARLCAGESGIGSDVEERFVNDAHFVELVLDGFGVTVIVKERVRYDERAFFVHYVRQLVESDGQTAFFDINLFRSAEPKHIFSPFCNSLNVYKVLDSHVFRNAVAAPRAATER